MSKGDAPSDFHMLELLKPIHERQLEGVVVVDHDCSMPT